MMKMEFKKNKSGQLDGKLVAVHKKFLQKAKKANWLAAIMLMTEANHRCPIDTGALSGHVYVLPNNPALINTIIFLEPYAARVHEGSKSDGYGSGTRSIARAHEFGVKVGPKFLTRAWKEERKKIEARIMQHVRFQ